MLYYTLLSFRAAPRVTTVPLHFIDSEDEIEVSCTDSVPLNLIVRTNEMSLRVGMAMFTTSFLILVA